MSDLAEIFLEKNKERKQKSIAEFIELCEEKLREGMDYIDYIPPVGLYSIYIYKEVKAHFEKLGFSVEFVTSTKLHFYIKEQGRP